MYEGIGDSFEWRTNLAAFFSILLGLFDWFFKQRLIGFRIEIRHGLTFRMVTRSEEFVRVGRSRILDHHERLFFNGQESLLRITEFFELTQRWELAQVL